MDSRIIATVLATAVVAVSCHDYRDDYLKKVQERVYLSTESSPVRYMSSFTESGWFQVQKSGKGFESAAVEISVSPTALVKYNEENGTRYVNLPSMMYYFEKDGEAIVIGKEEFGTELGISWDADILSLFLLTQKDDYVIPLKITASSMPVTEGRDLLLLHPVVPTIGLRARLSREIVYSDTLSGQNVFSERVMLNHPIPTRDISVKLAPASTEGYTSSAGSVPEGAFTLLSQSVTIEKGQTYADFSFRIDYDKFLSGTDVTTTAPCVAAVKLESTSIEYLPISQDIMYFPFRYQKPKSKK